MSDRKTPLCHRMMGAPDWLCAGDAETWRCQGSDCAAWVAEGSIWSASAPTHNPTGRGWCADNLRCQPWKDPAKEDDNG